MKSPLLIFSVLILFAGCNSPHSKKANIDISKIDPLSTKGVLDLMQVTSEWQNNHLFDSMTIGNGKVEPLTTNNWVRAAYLSGLMAYYDVTKNKETFDFVNNLCKGVNYKLGERLRHADDFAIGRVYTDIYLNTQDKTVIADMISRIDGLIENPGEISETGWPPKYGWTWCDALFMAPPAWLKLYTCTGKRKYLNEMNIGVWDTYNFLYSKEDSLFYRDGGYKWDENGNGRKTGNGNKIFWGRGNGWVVGGLTYILTYIPGDFPDREKYTQLFREMNAKIASLQGDDGMWRASLLDAEQYPTKEFSGSAFFCYSMAWGINHQILDKETYWPLVQKAWKGMVGCIEKDGKIGYVQLVGASPQSVKAEETMEYGAGAFLLAGKEIYEILNK